MSGFCLHTRTYYTVYLSGLEIRHTVYTVALAPALTGSGYFKRRFRSSLGQCNVLSLNMDFETEKKSEAFLEYVHKNVLIYVSEAP